MSDGTQFPPTSMTGQAPTPFSVQAPAPSAFDPDLPGEESVTLTRAQVRKMREMENTGVPFRLFRSGGMEAKVRAWSMSDKLVLGGLPPKLQQEWVQALNDSRTRNGRANRTASDMLKLTDNDETVANICCVAGFIWPRVVMTEDQLDGTDDCWLVTDLHIQERTRYMNLVLGGGNDDDMKQIATFLSAGVAAG